MDARFPRGRRWLTGIVVVLTLWWGWQLQQARVERDRLTRTASAMGQRIAQVRTEIAQVHRVDRGTLDALAHATQRLYGVVRQWQQDQPVTLTCQEPTTLTLATLTLGARRCQLTMPPTDLLAMIEVIHAIEQTQVILARVRLHVTEGMTMEVQVIGPVEPTRPQTIGRDTE